jgi:hypothetical protein
MTKKDSNGTTKSGAQRSRECYSKKLSAGTRRLSVWVCPANRPLFEVVRAIDWSKPIKDGMLREQLMALSDSNAGLANLVADPVVGPVEQENPAADCKPARNPNKRPTQAAGPAGKQSEFLLE